MCERTKRSILQLEHWMNACVAVGAESWAELSWVVHSLVFPLLVFDIWQYVRRIRFAFCWKKVEGQLYKTELNVKRRTWWWRWELGGILEHCWDEELQEKIVYDLIWVSFCVLCERVFFAIKAWVRGEKTPSTANSVSSQLCFIAIHITCCKVRNK